MDFFLTTFSKYVQSEDILILAVSGGVDSMVLLDLVLWHHPREKIVVAHLNHSLRWAESDEDSDFVADFCKKNNMIFNLRKLDIAALALQEKMSIEAVARKYRYDFLLQIARKYSAKYILTAHHLDDRIETMIFNLLRGTKLWGIHALAPIQKYEEYEISFFRPLLSISKSEILEYAQMKNIDYREDSSNMSPEYQRNHIRHMILPHATKINPEYREALKNFIEYSEELKRWIDREVWTFVSDSQNFHVKDFEKQSLFFQKEVIRYLYERANHGTVGLSEGNIEELRRYILTASGATEKHLGELKLRKKRGNILIG